METLIQICKKDNRYKELVKDSSLVKNAVVLLGGRRILNGRGNRKEKHDGSEGEEDGEGEEGAVNKGEEERIGRGGDVDCREMSVGEKISLIELLSELVKRGVEVSDEEELKEMKTKKETLEAEKGRLEEENTTLKKELSRLRNDEGVKGDGEGDDDCVHEERKTEKVYAHKLSEITLLSEMHPLFGDWTILRTENNSIIHSSEETYVSAFLGETLNNSVHRMFEHL